MALVVVCGQPCSGKSEAVRLLTEALSGRDPKPRVRIIDEDPSHLDRTGRYADAAAEKNLRGMVRSQVDRSLSTDTVTIVDSLNNIKGYRYELWCLARAAATLYCVLYCDVPDPLCRRWNAARRQAGRDSYSDAVLEDLLARFERPDRRNRWDSPLFELGDEGLAGAVQYLTGGSGGAGAHRLQPTVATRTGSGGSGVYELDRATLEVVEAVVEAQREYGGSGNPGGVWVGEGLPPVRVVAGRVVGLPELRRLRRTFVKLAGRASLTGTPPADLLSAKRMFVDYLNRELETCEIG